jgi:hypothetical protein
MPYSRLIGVVLFASLLPAAIAYGGPCPEVTLSYCSYLGGSGSSEQGYDIVVDRLASRYIVAGETTSDDFPTTPNAYDRWHNALWYATDIFLSSFDADDHSLVASTYFGGSYGETLHGLEVDPAGNVYLVGESDSHDLPTTPGAIDSYFQGYWDGFVASLTGDLCTLRWCTYLGHDKFNAARALAYDPDGYLYVGMGSWFGPLDFAHAPGATAVVFKLDTDDGSLVWCGSVGEGTIMSLQLTADDGLLVAGVTTGEVALSEGAYDTIRNGVSDLFVIKLDKDDGDLEWGTYLGGDGFDYRIDIATGSEGQALFAAHTGSEDFPLSPTGWGVSYRGDDDIVVGALSGDGATLLWSRDIGGSGYDGDATCEPGLELDDIGNMYVVSSTVSPDLPTDGQSLYPAYMGNVDAVLASVTQDGETCNWITYLGGVAYETGFGLALVQSGVLATGAAYAIDGVSILPVTDDAFDSTCGGPGDAFIMELHDPIVVGLAVAEESLAQEGDDVVLRWRLNGEVTPGAMTASVDVGGETCELEIRDDGESYAITDSDVCRDGARDRTYTIWMREDAGYSYPLVQRSYTPLCGAPAWGLRAVVAAGGGVDFLLQAGSPATVVVEIFDLAGRRLNALPAAQVATGETSLGWDGRDDRGRAVPGGKYVARCVADGRTPSAPFVVLK